MDHKDQSKEVPKTNVVPPSPPKQQDKEVLAKEMQKDLSKLSHDPKIAKPVYPMGEGSETVAPSPEPDGDE